MSCQTVECLKSPLLCPVIASLSRVINAGKSTLNEDQACCEVLVVKRRSAGTSTPNRTPMSRRRSSLPNGEGLGLRENLVSHADRSWHFADTFYDPEKCWLTITKYKLHCSTAVPLIFLSGDHILTGWINVCVCWWHHDLSWVLYVKTLSKKKTKLRQFVRWKD